MKRNRFHLTDRQQLLVGLALIILLAISMLYCLGLASVAVHQVWERTAQPGSEPNPVDEIFELTSTPAIEITAPGPAPR